MRTLKLCLVLATAIVFVTAGTAMAGETLDTVKARGFIKAGVNGDVYGFSMPDEKGVWKGLDVDTARRRISLSLKDTIQSDAED